MAISTSVARRVSHPEEPVGGDEPKLTRALQDGHLMSRGDSSVPVRRGSEHGTRAGKRGRKEL
jgi:hypothetical protein